MNDRFKFRCWDKENKKMYNDLTSCPNDIEITSINDVFQEYLNDGNNILMQCTGLKDKNSKLIYEGDIVKVCDVSALGYVRERIGEVVYGYSFYPAFIIETTLGDVKDFTDDMEVIGNKFENPELLKECE